MSEAVKAVRVSAFFDSDQIPGSFDLTGRANHKGIHGLIYACPCGCGEIGSLHFAVGDDAQSPSWKWDGNEDAPTLTPSIRRLDGCKWHGFLTKGQWIGV